MTIQLEPSALPLRQDVGGVVRVGATRVALESVLDAYLEGESAEGIVERFPGLELADVHATLAWFLRHRETAESYLEGCRRERSEIAADAERRAPAAGLRTRLRARRPR